MENSWTREEIDAIFVQLNSQNLPFKKYEFTNLGEGLKELGAGNFSKVYEAVSKKHTEKKYAIKVIGFSEKTVETSSFQNIVNAQKDLGEVENHIVKIYDSVELCVNIQKEHEVTNVEKIESYNEKKSDELSYKGNCLFLKFIVMEKVTPVIQKNKFTHILVPHKLAAFEELEIVKLAYDIGRALDLAHRKNIIHRDIKLENIFWDSQNNRYKLGDFGIACITKDGFADTVAFTKGYGAPEVVGTLEDKYDGTSDIYSLGMMLYVLLNELKFPESKNYHPNVMQYKYGYVAPEPISGSDELCQIVLKMIRFHPDDRYQSLEEVLNDLEKIKYGKRVKYQREHKSGALAVGSALAICGAGVLKLSVFPDLVFHGNLWLNILLLLCLGKGILCIYKKDIAGISIGILGVGIMFLLTTGFSIEKLLLLIFLTFIGRETVGIFAGMVIVMESMSYISIRYSIQLSELMESKWIAVFMLSAAVVLLSWHYILGERDEELSKIYFSKNRFWVLVMAIYATWIVFPMVYKDIPFFQKYTIIGILEKVAEWMLYWDLPRVGVAGILLCILWIGREKLLRIVNKE